MRYKQLIGRYKTSLGFSFNSKDINQEESTNASEEGIENKRSAIAFVKDEFISTTNCIEDFIETQLHDLDELFPYLKSQPFGEQGSALIQVLLLLKGTILKISNKIESIDANEFKSSAQLDKFATKLIILNPTVITIEEIAKVAYESLKCLKQYIIISENSKQYFQNVDDYYLANFVIWGNLNVNGNIIYKNIVELQRQMLGGTNLFES